MSRTWVNGSPPFLNADNLNALEADVTTALGVPDAALAGRVVAGATAAALNATYAKLVAIDVTAPKYGAKGDGTTDDTAAITAAVADLPSSGGILTSPPNMVFKTTANISITGKSNLTVDFNGSQIVNTTSSGAELLTIQGSFTSNTTYATVAIGARTTTVTVNSAAGLVAGDIIVIRSSGEVFNPDRPTQDYKAELARIASIAGNVLTLESETWDSYSITGFTVNVGKVSPIKDVTIRNLRIKGGGTGLTQTALHVKYFDGLRVDNVWVDSTETYGILSNTGYNQVVKNCVAENCDQDGLGYGFLANGIDGVTFEACKGRKNRHSFDLSDQNTALVRNARIVNVLAEDDKAAGISTHCADQVLIADSMVRDCGGGIILRGARGTIARNKVYGSKTLVQSSQTYYNGITVGDNGGTFGAGIGGIDLEIFDNLIDISNPNWATDGGNSVGILSTAGLKNARIERNKIRGFSAHGIYLQGDQNSNVRIEDNVIDCTSQVGTVGVDYAYGILIQPSHNTVTANVTTGLRVRHNRIKGAIRSAVYVQGGYASGTVSDDIRVTHNDIIDYGVTGVDFHAGYFGSLQLVERNNFTSTLVTPSLSNILDYGSAANHVKLPRVAVNDVGTTLVVPLQAGQQMGAALRSGLWYGPLGSSSGSTMADGSLFATPFFVPRRVTLNTIGINVTTAGVAGTKIRLGIYADIVDGVGGYPANLVVDAGQVAGDAIAFVSAAISTIVEPGLYWLVAAAQGGAPSVTGLGGQSEIIGTTSAASISGRSAYRQLSVSGALPSTFSSTVDAQGGGPLIQVKVA